MRKFLEGEFIQMAKEQGSAERELLHMPNVVGVALGRKSTAGVDTGENAITVLVRHKLPTELLAAADVVPAQVGKYRTDVIDTGDIFAQPLDGGQAAAQLAKQNGASAPGLSEVPAVVGVDTVTPQTLKQRIRPAMGGFSVGHPRVTAGTIATCCYDATPFPGIPTKYYILSNNHVLANSNVAAVGDPILQPGAFDGGTAPADVIGRLARFVPIQFHTGASQPLNFVDAAIAEVEFHMATREIYWIGYLNRKLPAVAPRLDDLLQKTGRTTNFTTGKVIGINATVDVNYGAGNVARFARQIVTSAMSAGGDSGSLVMDLEERAVGLLFAGSASVTIMNPIDLVQAALKIRLTELPV